MSASTPRRAPLEPFFPALVGIGLVHVLLGMCVWIIHSLLPPRSIPSTVTSPWTWRSPADYLIEPKLPEVKPEPVVTLTTPPSAPIVEPKPMPQTAVATQTSINHTAVKGVDPKPAPKIDILSARMNEAVSRLPADTLANLEKSMTSSSGGLLSPDNPFLASQSVIAPQSSTVPAAPNAIPGGSPPASPAGQGRAANKYITLSFNDDTYQGVRAKPMLNLLDIAKLNEATRSGNLIATGSLDAVEKALQQALLREWEPPLISAVPHSQRRVTVNLVIMRDGSVKDAVIQKPSGSDVLDASVRAALGRVTKIAESLPSSFPKERYPLRVNLLIE